MLPEGATPSGTSTGVQKVLLDNFYNKTERAKMSQTHIKKWKSKNDHHQGFIDR